MKLVIINSIKRNNKSFLISGWTIDSATKNRPDMIAVTGGKLKAISWYYCGQINTSFDIPPNIECGFRIEIVDFNEFVPLTLFFCYGNKSKKIKLKLYKEYSHWKEKAIVEKSYYQLLQKGFLYLQKHSVRETLSKLKKGVIGQDYLYQIWIKKNVDLDTSDFKRNLSLFRIKPKISIIIPVYNVDIKYLSECVNSVKNQSYRNWELCIADDNSTNVEILPFLKEIEKSDVRIKVVFREKNGHISAASNSALSIATGEFVGFLDNDDTLDVNALYEIVKVINKDPKIDIIYSDEDKINEHNKRFNPYFKSDWAPDSFLGGNYICHFTVIKRKLIDEVGAFRIGYEGAQDYDLLLRATEKAEKIYHIPKILYHWRMLKSSTAMNANSKSYAFSAGQRALEDALVRRKIEGSVEQGDFPGIYNIKFTLKQEDMVTIIIPTKNHGIDLEKCINSIVKKTSYSNYEIIIADNGTTCEETIRIIEKLKNRYPKIIRVLEINIPFNFSRINNIAAKEAKGKYLLFLNNDTEVINSDWMINMVRILQFDHIGVVGAKLFYPDDTIQHSGVVMGIGGMAGHIHYGFSKTDYGYYGKLVTNTNYLCVTAACCMVKSEDFWRVDGFDEEFEVAFNDVDFCLKLFEFGKYNVFVHDACLYHFESKSRGYEDTPEKKERFTKEINLLRHRWLKYIENDPFYNINLTRKKSDFSLDI